MNLIDEAISGNLEKVKEILLKDPSIINKSKYGYTALEYASIKGHLEIVKELLKNGAGPKTGPLYEASKNGHLEIVKYLLEQKVNPNYQNKYGTTSILLAATEGHINIVKELLKYGADPNLPLSQTPLIRTSRYNKLQIVEELLENGADPNIQDENGNSALMLASRYGNLKVVEKLLEYGADPNLQNKSVDINKMGYRIIEHGNTALNMATKGKHIEVIEKLLEYGANPFIKNKNGNNAFDLCEDDECKERFTQYIKWKDMKKIDNIFIDKISNFPKDINKIIILKRRQQQLCKNLSDDKNKFILYFFALDMGLPVKRNMTKNDLCQLIGKRLTYSKEYDPVIWKKLVRNNSSKTFVKKETPNNVSNFLNYIRQSIGF